jgi:hypothetical protein
MSLLEKLIDMEKRLDRLDQDREDANKLGKKKECRALKSLPPGGCPAPNFKCYAIGFSNLAVAYNLILVQYTDSPMSILICKIQYPGLGQPIHKSIEFNRGVLADENGALADQFREIIRIMNERCIVRSPEIVKYTNEVFNLNVKHMQRLARNQIQYHETETYIDAPFRPQIPYHFFLERFRRLEVLDQMIEDFGSLDKHANLTVSTFFS